MKVCTKCRIEKELNDFGKCDRYKGGIFLYCKECVNNKNRINRRTKSGLIIKIYFAQIYNSKKRGHKKPMYTKQELHDWIYSQNNFNTLYNNWKQSGYKKMLAPSIDRLDDSKLYSFDNIQLISWNDNNNKHYKQIREGRLPSGIKTRKKVKQIEISTGKVIKEFCSQQEASRQTIINQRNISLVCLGKTKTAGGYIWKYN